MKKITKGAIAASAAALLLVGGGGTFMSWNQDDAITVSAISAGSLTLDTTDAAVWTLNGDDVTAGIDRVRIVPGDVLQFSQAARIDAVGDNIQGTLDLVPGTITAADPGNAADEQLLAALTESEGTRFVLESYSDGLTQMGDIEGAYEFSEAGVYEANLTATFDFGINTVDEVLAQGGQVKISGLQLALVQTGESPDGEVI